MAVSLPAAELGQGLTALTDLVTAVRANLADKADDEQVVSDGFTIAEDLLPQYALALAAANFLLDMLITYDTQGTPDSQTPMFGGSPASRIAPP
jgi:hypothetical protein